MNTEGRKIYLRVIGKPEFTLRRDFLSLIFWWQRETSAKNVVWVRVLVVGIHWPPIMHICCFHEVDKNFTKKGAINVLRS